METSLVVSGTTIPLNDFTQNYIGNVLQAIVRSLGEDSSQVTLCIDSEELSIYTEKGELNYSSREFAQQLIENTVKGVLSPLRGVLWLQKITIQSKLLGTSQTVENIELV